MARAWAPALGCTTRSKSRCTDPPQASSAVPGRGRAWGRSARRRNARSGGAAMQKRLGPHSSASKTIQSHT